MTKFKEGQRVKVRAYNDVDLCWDGATGYVSAVPPGREFVYVRLDKFHAEDFPGTLNVIINIENLKELHDGT